MIHGLQSSDQAEEHYRDIKNRVHVLKDVSINMNYTDENSDTIGGPFDKESANRFRGFPSNRHQPFQV